MRRLTTISPEGRQGVTTLDGQGRVTRLDLGAGLAPVTLTYDSLGRGTQITQGSQSWSCEYDGGNRAITRRNAAGSETQYAYDAADRLVQLTRATGRTLGFAYDVGGNRTQVVMPSATVHSLAYTALSLLQAYTPGGGGSSYDWTYTLDRAPSRVTLPSGRTVDEIYDAGGRPAGTSYTEAAVSFDYADATGRMSRLARTPVGGGPAQAIGFTYAGDLVTGMSWTGLTQGEYTYTYDANAFLVGLNLVSGADAVTTPLTRDADGLLTRVGPFTLTRGGPDGLPSQIGDGTLGLALTYDALARLASRTQTVSGQSMYQAQLVYDSVDQMVQKTETVAGTVITYNYAYDADGQLKEVRRGGTVVETYSYDANGNRTSRQVGGNPAEAASYDAQDRLTQRGGVSYQFDNDGFLAQRGTDTFQYSARGELLQATVAGQTITYAYDGLGRRVGRTDGGGSYQYLYGNPGNPFQVTAARAATGTLTTYFYDEEGLLFAFQRGGARFYVATDQVGSPRVVSNAAGVAVKVLAYDSFGILTSDSDPGFDLPIGFAGGLADATTGLVRFGFRDYDTAAGRWTARDPVFFAGGQANLYVYVGNHPVNRRDPLGLWCLGGSFYTGLGTGAEVCETEEGHSVCFEGGYGFGGSLESRAGGLASSGEEYFAEGKAKCGQFGVTVGGKYSFCKGEGEFKLKVKVDAGPITAEIDTSGSKKAGARASLGDPASLPFGGCKLQAKVGAKFCRRF